MAYGTNAPFGLRPLKNNTGSTWVERRTPYRIPDSGGNNPVGYAVSIFRGDLVNPSIIPGEVNTINLYLPDFTITAGNAANTFGQTQPVLGVFQDCEYYDINNVFTRSPIWPASTTIYPGTTITAYINDDPNVVWEVQVSTPINAIDANADFAGGSAAGATCAPFFPGTSATGANVSGIGSNYSIMGGGGKNFNLIPIDPLIPTGDKYTNNPTSTMTATAIGTPIAAFGTNPYGGDVRSGQSGAYLCVSTYGTNATDTFTGDGSFVNAGSKDYDHKVATLPLKVVDYSPNNIIRPGKTLQTTPFVTVLVTINNHVFKPGTPGTAFA
jgi:hypothetical protein